MDDVDALFALFVEPYVFDAMRNFDPRQPSQTLHLVWRGMANGIAKLEKETAAAPPVSILAKPLRDPNINAILRQGCMAFTDWNKTQMASNPRCGHLRALIEAADRQCPFIPVIAIMDFCLTARPETICDAGVPGIDARRAEGEERSRVVRNFMHRTIEGLYYPYLVLLDRLDSLARGEWPKPVPSPGILIGKLINRIVADPILVHAEARLYRNAAAHDRHWAYLPDSDSVLLSDRNHTPVQQTVDGLMAKTGDMFMMAAFVAPQAGFDYILRSFGDNGRMAWLAQAIASMADSADDQFSALCAQIETRVGSTAREIESFFTARSIRRPVAFPDGVLRFFPGLSGAGAMDQLTSVSSTRETSKLE